MTDIFGFTTIVCSSLLILFAKKSVIRVSVSLLLCFVHHRLIGRIVFPFLESSHCVFRSKDSEFVDFSYWSFLSLCKVAQIHAYLLFFALDVHSWYPVFHLLKHLGWSNYLGIFRVVTNVVDDQHRCMSSKCCRSSQMHKLPFSYCVLGTLIPEMAPGCWKLECTNFWNTQTIHWKLTHAFLKMESFQKVWDIPLLFQAVDVFPLFLYLNIFFQGKPHWKPKWSLSLSIYIYS